MRFERSKTVKASTAYFPFLRAAQGFSEGYPDGPAPLDHTPDNAATNGRFR